MYYIIPGFLICLGISINILISSIYNVQVLSQLGSLIPWVIFLLVPCLIKYKNINTYILWNYAYYIILTIIILGFIDYLLIFNDPLSYQIIPTQYGNFLNRINFSLIHVYDNGLPHVRFNAVFPEAGDLAMMILPFIVYSIHFKKYFGLIILSIGFYFTFSLGGWISLILFFILFLYKKTRDRINFFLVYLF